MRLLASVAICASAAMATGCGSSGSGEEPLTVGAASSLRTALSGDENPEGQRSYPVRISFAGSDLIAAQIRQGAGIDVIAAASTTEPDALFEDGLVERPVPYAQNELVIAVPLGSDIDSITDLASPSVSLVVGDDAVPVGAYTREVIDGLPDQTADAIEENVRSEEPDAASISAKLVQGAADAGFVYATDIRSAPDEIKAVEIPPSLQPEIIYSAAVVRESPMAGAGAEYIDGLLTGDGADRLRAAGFLPAP